MDDLFGAPGTPWVRVRPALARMRRSVLVAVAALAVLVVVVLAVVTTAAVLLALVAVALLAGWLWWLVGRNVANWGYAEREDELWITSGAWARRLVVVPYGRMQLVDVTVGPLERAFGLAAVQLHTASPATNARIPGLEPDEAARLRDRLTELGASEQSGL